MAITWLTRQKKSKNIQCVFRTIRTLKPDERVYIFERLSFVDGGMHALLENNTPRVPVCLVYHKTRLIAWAALELDKTTMGYDQYDQPSIGAYVDRKFRRQGIAKFAIKQLLTKYKKYLSRYSQITAYHPVTVKIIRESGFNPMFGE